MRPSRHPLTLSAALLAAAVLASVAPAAAAPPAARGDSPATARHLAAQILSKVGPGAHSLGTASSDLDEGPAGGLAAKVPFGKLSAKQIKSKAAAAVQGASYFEVQGYEEGDTERYTVGYLVNKAASYEVLIWSEGTLRVLRIGNTIYLQYDAQLLKAKGLPEEYDGKWMVVGRTDPDFQVFAALSTPTRWAQYISKANVTKRAKGATFGGYPTIRLIGSGRLGDSLYVSTTGPAYPRYFMGNDKSFTYSLMRYNEIFTLDPPEPDSIITG
jgi:hypothetical protein